MENYFLVKVTYSKKIEEGVSKNITESHLFQVLTYKEAEDKAVEVLKDNISFGEFNVSEIKKVSYNELFPIKEKLENNDLETYWYECKASLVILDENSGNEKKINDKYLVEAISINEAISSLCKILKDSNGDEFRILSVVETPIISIFDIKDLNK